MIVRDIRHDFPKQAGYTLVRPQGRPYYIFAHYLRPVTLTLGNVTYETQPGACVLIEPNLPHFLSVNDPLIHNWIHIEATPEQLPEMYKFPLNEPFYFPHHEQISERFRRIEVEFFSTEAYRESMLDAYLTEFFIWMYRSLQSPNGNVAVPKVVEANMTALRRRILSHPKRNWNIEQLAKTVALSPSRFHAVYKTMFGSTPYQDMIMAKVDSAKTLLLSQPELTLKTAAELLGYNDQYHFIRQFKSVTGQTPGQYRKLHEKEYTDIDPYAKKSK